MQVIVETHNKATELKLTQLPLQFFIFSNISHKSISRRQKIYKNIVKSKITTNITENNIQHTKTKTKYKKKKEKVKTTKSIKNLIIQTKILSQFGVRDKF